MVIEGSFAKVIRTNKGTGSRESREQERVIEREKREERVWSVGWLPLIFTKILTFI